MTNTLRLNTRMSKVLLTGVTGFLGSSLAKGLLNSGYQVVGLKRFNSDIKNIASIISSLSLFNVEDGINNLFLLNPDIDFIIHGATNYGNKGQLLTEILLSNIVFPLQIIESIPAGKRISFINTDTYFSKMSENYDYLSYYIQTKKIFRSLATQLAVSKKCPFISMQLEHVYGVGDSLNKFVSNTIQRLIHNESCIDLTAGEQSRDFIYVDDVVNAYLHVIGSKELIESGNSITIEVGTGKSVTIQEFMTLAKKITKSSSTLNFGKIPYRNDELMKSAADNKILEQLGWSPKVTLEVGIEKLSTSLRFD